MRIKDTRSTLISFPEPALPLSRKRILGADQKNRTLWERDWTTHDVRSRDSRVRVCILPDLAGRKLLAI